MSEAAVTADEALRAEDARYNAQIAGDHVTLERLLAEDLVYVHSSAKLDGKASYIESIRSGRVRFRSMRRTEVAVRTYGALALIHGVGHFDVDVGGERMAAHIRFTSVWAKRSSGLQFIAWHATPVPAGA
jgi:ketosteroid isomerase-like protein